MSENPFLIRGYKSGEYFCDRDGPGRAMGELAEPDPAGLPGTGREQRACYRRYAA